MIPIEHHHNLSRDSGKLLSDGSSYRRLIGRLIYLTITRPYISYAVHILSQFIAAPTDAHHEATLKLVRYLKGAPGQGLLLPSTNFLL